MATNIQKRAVLATSLRSRRLQLLRELARVNRQIADNTMALEAIQGRMTALIAARARKVA